jgi:hypothetical protein
MVYFSDVMPPMPLCDVWNVHVVYSNNTWFCNMILYINVGGVIEMIGLHGSHMHDNKYSIRYSWVGYMTSIDSGKWFLLHYSCCHIGV